MAARKNPQHGKRHDTGRRLDYQVMGELRDAGYHAGRSALGHGLIHVWAFHPTTGKIKFIQIRSVAYRKDWEDASTKELRRVAEAARNAGNSFVGYEIWLKYPRLHGVQKIVLSGFEDEVANA